MGMTEEEEKKEKKLDPRLQLLYKDLSEEVRHRGQMYATIQSIFITGSLLAVSFVLKDILKLHWVLVVGTLLVAFLLVYSAKTLYETTKKLDEIFFEHMRKLEDKMNIDEGRSWLFDNKIKCTPWYLKIFL